MCVCVCVCVCDSLLLHFDNSSVDLWSSKKDFCSNNRVDWLACLLACQMAIAQHGSVEQQQADIIPVRKLVVVAVTEGAVE